MSESLPSPVREDALNSARFSPSDGGSTTPSFRAVFAVFAKIGLLSFGGPAGQIALMHRELVETRRWISEARFLHALNYCMLLPGPEAQQLATYIGWLLYGVRGGIAAGGLFILPGFAVILTLSGLYAHFHETDWLRDVFFGLKAAVLAIVIDAVIKVARRALKTRALVIIAALSFIALYAAHAPFPAIIAVAALAGFLGTRLGIAGLTPAAVPRSDALIDVAFEARAPRKPTLAGSMATALIWIAIWLAPIGLAVLVLGADSGFVSIGMFFAKLAVVTFGGAYAVLAYVADVAVNQLHWLRPGEMLDGLALAETTPGPLLLVLPFVGFQAAYRFGDGTGGLLAGILGGALTTWVTFAPSFLWIFLGGPYIERLRGARALSGALAAITAAVVGVILNLAIWFALHTLFYDLRTFEFGPFAPLVPLWQTLDLKAAALALIAVGLIFRLRIGVVWTLVACGALGWLLKLLG